MSRKVCTYELYMTFASPSYPRLRFASLGPSLPLSSSPRCPLSLYSLRIFRGAYPALSSSSLNPTGALGVRDSSMGTERSDDERHEADDGNDEEPREFHSRRCREESAGRSYARIVDVMHLRRCLVAHARADDIKANAPPAQAANEKRIKLAERSAKGASGVKRKTRLQFAFPALGSSFFLPSVDRVLAETDGRAASPTHDCSCRSHRPRRISSSAVSLFLAS